MALVGELLVMIAGNSLPLTAALAKSEAEIKGFSATAGTHGGIVSGALGAVGTAGLAMGATVGIGAALAIHSAADFQEQMAIINTIAHQTPAELDKTGEAIRNLADSTGLGLSDMTKGFYDLLSAGVPVGHAMSVLKDSTTLAIGGLASTAQTVDLLTTAINSYHLTTAGASKATDQFALAVQDGKVTAAQIAATFADVAPLAKQMGVGIDEISATYAVLTARGVPAAEATTQMNRAMIELLKPNKDLNELQEKTHLNFAKIAGDKGLVVALNEMREAATANHVPFQDLFGRLEGMKFALATTGPNFAAYGDELAKMHHANGTAAAQAAERGNTLGRAIAELGNQVDHLLGSTGKPMLDWLTSVVHQIGGGVAAVREWAGQFPNLAVAIGSLIPSLGAIPGVVGAAADAIGGVFSSALDGIRTAIGWLEEHQSAIPLVAGAIGGPLVLAFGAWAIAAGAAAAATLLALAPILAIGAAVGILAAAFITDFGGIRTAVTGAVSAIAPILQGVLGSAIRFIGDAVAVVSQWFGNFVNGLTGARSGAQATGSILSTLSHVISTITTVVSGAVSWFVQLATTVIDNANKLGVFKAIGDAIYAWFGLLGNALRIQLDLFGQLAGVVAGALTTAFNGIGFVVNTLAQAIRDTAAAIQSMIDLAGKAVGAVAAIPGVKLGGDLVGGAGDAARNLLGALPHFDTGGIVPGSGPQLIVAHGGERVTPAGQGGAIHLHHTTVLQIGDERIEELIERVLYRSGSALNSGWAGAE